MKPANGLSARKLTLPTDRPSPPNQTRGQRYSARTQTLLVALLLAVFVLAELSLVSNQRLSISLWAGVMAYFLFQLARRSGPAALHTALGLLAATRLLNLGLADVLVTGSAGLVGLSLLVGTLLAFRRLRELDTLYRVTTLGPRFQLWVALSGLGLGYLAYLLRPATPDPVGWALLATILTVLVTALGEELFFRVLLVRALVPILNPYLIIGLSALLYGALHLYWGGPLAVLFAFQVGVFFGWVVIYSRSYIGVVAAHTLLNLMSFIVLPYLLA